jgi:propionyl-CoA synthetase
MSLKSFVARSLSDRQGFWAEQAGLIHWEQPFTQVLDDSRPPFARWFVGGRTNLCFNAIDRHLATQAGTPALICGLHRDRLRAHLDLRANCIAEVHAQRPRSCAAWACGAATGC